MVAIIGILAVVSMSKLQRALRSAREGRTFAHLATLRTCGHMRRALNNGALIMDPPGEVGSWTLTACCSANDHRWADGNSGDGNPGPEWSKFITQLPLSEAGLPVFTGGFSEYSRGVWSTTRADWSVPCSHSSPLPWDDDNNRGWFFNAATGDFYIHNGTFSLEGRRYKTY